jgi:hypothetical protein
VGTEPEIMFKGVNRTIYIDKLITRRIAKLEQVCNYIVSTRVTVEQIQTLTGQIISTPFELRFGIFMINIFATPNP